MANERYDENKYDGQEEGEYHFSDDQVNYDLDAGVPKMAAASGGAAVASAGNGVATRISSSRRLLIGIVVFVFLLAIVYKMFVPASNVPASDFDSQNQSASANKSFVKPANVRPNVVSQQPAAPVIPVQQPSIAASNAQPAQVMAPSQPTPVASAVSVPPPVVQQLQPSVPEAAAIPQQQPMLPPTQAVTTPQQQSVPPVPSGNVADRLASLEQQNTAMMSLMQNQYAQKITDYEAQNNQMRTQIQELNTRVAGMEVAFRQLTKILRSMNKTSAPGMVASNVVSAQPVMRSMSSRMNYTVQAIIPGRAWLKSDSGDTVTVAEGDVLKDYGRITKIDPYDGVVAIDTGNKVITLSYGSSGD